MNAQLAIALFKVITGLLRYFEEQRWYQDGKAAAYAEMDAEQRKRVEAADAARADADALNAAGGLRNDDGHQRAD